MAFVALNSAVFLKGAVKETQFPALSIPEFAFFGRSNAGKSSLINMLLNRKNLVKTGSRPGMTQEINFFLINAPAGTQQGAAPTAQKGGISARTQAAAGKGSIPFCIADLPGYGYAQVSDAARRRIDRMLYEYATTRSTLKTLFFLIDIRRMPGDVEVQSIAFFRSHGIETLLVGTKIDKISKNEQVKQLNIWADFFECSKDSILLTSSSKKYGREKLLAHITQRLA
ncbi:MAG: GTP-binding protein [Treponema sp.]